MTCPNCQHPMVEETLDAHMGTSVTIDICFACQAFWFDDRESLRLTPASTLRLFRLIGDHPPEKRQALRGAIPCPRCGVRLSPVQDIQRSTRFQYRRCAGRHGRFITFFDFLREKNFITPMSTAQIEDLRRHVGAVNCSNCGASIDLARHSSCTHCGSALSIIDATQAERLVAQLRAADRSGAPVDPVLPLRLEQARREVAQSFGAFDGHQDASWFQNASSSGPVLAGLQALAQWLRRQV